MTVVPDEGILVVNRYRLLSGKAAYQTAVAALAGRVRAEGHQGVLEYRFYSPDVPDEGRAVVRYHDAGAWVAHHDIIMGWPEMAAFRAVAALEQVDLHGEVTSAMADWIDRMGLADKVRFAGTAVAGFRR